jgi:ElaB/YqjD/DUF883 family membrane-anchored ribosome-binding protein
MAEPDLRDAAPSEPVRRPGPQPIRPASSQVPAIDPSHELPAHASEPQTSSAPTSPTPNTHSRTSGVSPRPARARTPSQEMLVELRSRLEHLRARIEKQTGEAGISLKRELNHDADYLKIRARDYHERRPLQTLGMVAAAGFVLGVFVGLWRR